MVEEEGDVVHEKDRSSVRYLRDVNKKKTTINTRSDVVIPGYLRHTDTMNSVKVEDRRTYILYIYR